MADSSIGKSFPGFPSEKFSKSQSVGIWNLVYTTRVHFLSLYLQGQEYVLPVVCVVMIITCSV